MCTHINVTSSAFALPYRSGTLLDMQISRQCYIYELLITAVLCGVFKLSSARIMHGKGIGHFNGNSSCNLNYFKLLFQEPKALRFRLGGDVQLFTVSFSLNKNMEYSYSVHYQWKNGLIQENISRLSNYQLRHFRLQHKFSQTYPLEKCPGEYSDPTWHLVA